LIKKVRSVIRPGGESDDSPNPVQRILKPRLLFGVLKWNYSTPLELIASKIPEKRGGQCFRAAAKRRLCLNQNFFL